ncbi:hypothetical protein DIP79_04580, partial [Acinetobacter baumannii]|nr:hypothetical protein [Acinetobacter baumannii]
FTTIYLHFHRVALLLIYYSPLFYVFFVIVGFCIQSLLRLTILSIALFALFFIVTRTVGYA